MAILQVDVKWVKEKVRGRNDPGALCYSEYPGRVKRVGVNLKKEKEQVLTTQNYISKGA